MRRWVVRGAFGLGHLSLETAASASAAGAPAPGRCRLRMTSWSLNYRDLLMVQGVYDPRLALPLVPLSDGVGVVEAVGEGVSRVQVGDRVCPTFSPTWIDGPPTAEAVRATRGGAVPGLLCDEVEVADSELVKVPAFLTDPEAAALPCAGVTAYNAVARLGAVGPGHRVLVIGSGGVSVFAARIAIRLGATVAAVTRSEAKALALRGLGAEHVVLSTEQPRWGRAIRAWSDGGVDLVVEVGGAGTFEQSLDAAKVGGVVAVIGNLAGSREPISVLPILMRQLRCEGVFVGHRASFEALCALLDAHGERPVVDGVFAFDEVPAAFDRLRSGGQVGKVCVSA